ncbi:MAG: LexA family protein [Clostridia bacterium]
MYLPENIRYLRKKHHLSQEALAGELGYKSFTTIQKWEKGIAEPPLSVLLQLAKAFQVDLDDLTGTDLSKGTKKKSTQAVSIPVLGKVAAGIPIEAIENIIDYEEIPADWINTGEYFGLQIKGRSMEPRILEGDVVIVRKQEDADTGDIAIVMVDGFEATCKKIKKSDKGIMLIPFNPEYEPVFYSNDEICALPVSIIGKVVELRGKL